MLLRAMAPGEWDRFVQAVRGYAAEANVEMLRSEPALLLRAQGVAVALNELSSVLATAPQAMDRMRTNGRPTHP